MVSTWNSGSTLEPLTTDTATFPEDATLGSFTFIDFLPECIDADGEGLFGTPVYESFR